MFKYIWLFFIFSTVLAAPIEIVTNPALPILGERFQLIFIIKSLSTDAPFVSFSSDELEVLGRTNRDVAVETKIVQGKITSIREHKYVYDVIANRSGSIKLRNIKIDIGEKKLTVKSHVLTVAAQREPLQEIFALAIPSKEQIFLGEGVTVDYYVYSKMMVRGIQVAEYPQVSKFYKRDNKFTTTTETVQYQGEIYRRYLQYSIRLYPEKTGPLSIPMMGFSVSYLSNLRYGSGEETKTIRSRRIALEVMPLPTKNVPKSFNGLVGKHHFNLTAPNTKYLVNEPIELRLSVEGSGALESFTAPEIYKDKNLEAFDTKSELDIIDNVMAKKYFDYTFLGRAATSIAARQLEVSYFDPEKQDYVVQKLSIPALKVDGTVYQGFRTEDKPVQSEAKRPVQPVSISKLLAPTFMIRPLASSWIFYINVFLGIFIAVIMLSFLYKKQEVPMLAPEVQKLCRQIKVKGPDYGTVHRLMMYLRQNDEEVSLFKIIEESSLSPASKRYFSNLVTISERCSYYEETKSDAIKYQKKPYKELMGHIAKNYETNYKSF